MAVMTRGRRTIHLVELGQTIPAVRRGGLSGSRPGVNSSRFVVTSSRRRHRTIAFHNHGCCKTAVGNNRVGPRLFHRRGVLRLVGRSEPALLYCTASGVASISATSPFSP